MNSIVIAATGRERKIIEGLQNDRINRMVEEDAAKNIDSCKLSSTSLTYLCITSFSYSDRKSVV